MTWNDMQEKMLKNGGKLDMVQNIIGHLMDDSESWDWDAEVTDDDIEAMKSHSFI
jgi:hypothetical protein